MACTYAQGSNEVFTKDLNSIHDAPTLLSKRQESKQIETNVIKLNRGGIVVETSIGPIQFGIPPETVKDSMIMGKEVPTYYIVPTQRFDRKFGINVAEFEFPAYFNFFIKRKQVSLICDQATAESIRIVFQETLLGPTDFTNIEQDFHPSVQPYVDFQSELAIFAKNPYNPLEKLVMETLLNFKIFNENKEVQIQDQVFVRQKGNLFQIIDNGKILYEIPDLVEFPKEYQKYIDIHKPDENLKAERLPPQVETIRKISIGKKPPSLTQSHISEEQLEKDFKELPRPSILLWNQQGQAMISDTNLQIDEQFSFEPPNFGVTILGCSHGFDPKGSTSGYIFWINGKGVMVDPPPFTSYHLKKMGIPPIMIQAIIISHCHGDHDAGAFHKILDDTKVEIITTRTIMYSFLRKHSAISGMSMDKLKNLFIFRPAIIGVPINVYGGSFEFFYAFHSIPCIGFRVNVQGKSIYFSGDTLYEPARLKDYLDKGLIKQARYDQLTGVKFNEDIILHEAGVPPIHTPQTVLAALPSQIKNKIYLVHVADKDLLKDSGLKIAKPGIENTIILIRPHKADTVSLARKLDIISKIDIFDQLNLTNAKWLLDSLVLESFKAGDTIIEQDQDGTKFYIIESGLAKVFSISKENQFERYLQVGDYFGESALIDLGKRKASVEAITDLKVLSLERHDFWFIFGDGFEGQGPVIRKMMRLMEARKSQAIHILFKNSSFSQLTPSQKTQMEMIMNEEEVEKGQIMWRIGDEPKYAFFIRRGCFEFYDCPEQKFEEFDSGAFIGEIQSLMNRKPLQTNVRSLRRGSIFSISITDMIAFLERNPGLHLLFQDQKFIE